MPSPLARTALIGVASFGLATTPALAAKIPSIQIWSGKTHNGHQGVSASRSVGAKTLQLSVAAPCTSDPSTPLGFGLHGVVSGSRYSLKTTEVGTSQGNAKGKLTVTGTITGKQVSGTFKGTFKVAGSTCTIAKDTFKAKYQGISHGG